jgi:hypothetical protein
MNNLVCKYIEDIVNHINIHLLPEEYDYHNIAYAAKRNEFLLNLSSKETWRYEKLPIQYNSTCLYIEDIMFLIKKDLLHDEFNMLHDSLDWKNMWLDYNRRKLLSKIRPNYHNNSSINIVKNHHYYITHSYKLNTPSNKIELEYDVNKCYNNHHLACKYVEDILVIINKNLLSNELICVFGSTFETIMWQIEEAHRIKTMSNIKNKYKELKDIIPNDVDLTKTNFIFERDEE